MKVESPTAPPALAFRLSPFAFFADLALLALAIVACHWRVFFTPGYWVPDGGGDIASTLLPFYRYAAEELRTGRLPLWNPYLYGGAPFLADIQTAVFYPINWITFLVAGDITYETLQGLVFVHLWIGAAGMYALARGFRWGGVGPLGRPAALIGALAYIFSDYFIVHLGNLNLVAGAAWLPWLTLAVVRGIADRRLLAFGLGGGALALALLAGHIQPFLYGLILAGVITLAGIGITWRCAGWRPAAGLALRALVLPVIAIGLTAVQLLPSAELRTLTGRSDIGYDAAIAYSLPPSQLLGLFVPDVFGRGPGSYWGPWPRVEMGYLGILPLFAAIAAITIRRWPATWIFAGIALLGLVMALGGYTVVHGWIYRFVPGFEGIRAPARAIVLFELAVALLAAIGVDALLGAIDDRRRAAINRVIRWTSFVLLGLLLGALPPFVFFLAISQGQRGAAIPRLIAITDGIVMFALLLGGTLLLFGLRSAGRLPTRVFGVLAVCWVAFDLLTAGFDVEGGNEDPAENYRRPTVVGYLKQDRDLFRIDTETGVWDVWQPAGGLYHRLGDVRGVDNPLMLADTQRYWAELGGRSGIPYDLLNVRYLLGHRDVPIDTAKFERVFETDPEIAVFRNRRALPRAWLVPSAQVSDSHEAAFRAIHRPEFDPRRTVIVEAALARTGGVGEVSITDYQSDRIDLRVTAPQGGYLVMSETWYPGWEASIDGQPAPLLRANYLFRAIWVDPGEHQVRFAFRPATFTAGAWLSATTLLVLGILGAITIIGGRLASARRSEPRESSSGRPGYQDSAFEPRESSSGHPPGYRPAEEVNP